MDYKYKYQKYKKKYKNKLEQLSKIEYDLDKFYYNHDFDYFDDSIPTNFDFSEGQTDVRMIERPPNQLLNYVFPLERMNMKSVDPTGLKLTDVSLYSVTGKAGANFITKKIIKHMGTSNLIVTDGTANVGSDAITFGLTFTKVNAVEINEVNFQALKNNIEIYNLKNKINLYFDDTLHLLNTNIISQDVIYIDAPWGGSDYKKKESVKLYIGDIEISNFFLKYRSDAKLFVFKVPINYDFNNFIRVIGSYDTSIYPYGEKKNKIKFYLIIIET